MLSNAVLRTRSWLESLTAAVVRLIQDYIFAPFQPAPLRVVQRRLQWIGIILLACFVLWWAALAIVRAWERYDSQPQQSGWYQAPSSQASGTVVIVHGWTKGPQDMREVAATVRGIEGLSQHGIYLWSYDSGRFSNKNPRGLADDLAMGIAGLHEQAKGEVILVGHSLGGLLLRRAFVTGLEDDRPWARAVSRIVLLAAPNRGTEATSRSRWLWLADSLAKSLGVGDLIRATYRGAPFIVDLRGDWIRRFRVLDKPPLVAQIVGSEDKIVSSSDSIDVLQFPNSISYQLPNSSHESIIRSAESGPYLREALTKQRDQKSQVPQNPASVFKLLLVHGIRDYGDRFEEIRDSVNAYAIQSHLSLKASSPRYTYFSALQFVNPVSRQHKIYEFADMYMEMLATPPVDAPLFFVGHSFGTYLMGKGMEMYKSIKFDRVYLAGSVLHEEFFARHGFLGDRIKYLRNDIATEDWPVGILCSGLDGLGLADDVGTGGFNGFTRVVAQDRIEQIKYFDGGHGKALEATNHPTIATWLLQGPEAKYDGAQIRATLSQASVLLKGRSFFWDLASRAAPGLFVIIITGIAYLLIIGRRPFVAFVGILSVMWLLNIV